MPYLTMCSPKRIEKICHDCYRRTAIPDQYQVYSRFKPSEDGNSCEYYMEEQE